MGELEHYFLDRARDCAHLRGQFEQALNEGQMGFALAISQEPIVADSDEALGQGVEEKAVDKVHRAEGGLFEGVVLAVFVPEADHAVFKINEATVGDSDAVGVTGQILQDILRIGDGVPHTDNPLVLVELTLKVGVNLFKVRVSLLSGSSELIDELAAKDQGEGFLIEQIGILARNLAFLLGAQGAPRDQTM